MRKLMLAIAILCGTAHAGPGAPVPLVHLGDIHGSALGWIRLAMPVFDQQLGGDIKSYAISVQEAGDIVHVVFHLTPDIRGQRGAAREGPGLDVEISKASGAVTASRVIR